MGLVAAAVAACGGQGLDARSCEMGLLQASATGTAEIVTLVDLYNHTVGLEVWNFRGDGRGSIVSHAYAMVVSGHSVMKLVCAFEPGTYDVADEIELSEHISTFTALDVDRDGLDDVVFVGSDAPTTLRVILARP